MSLSVQVSQRTTAPGPPVTVVRLAGRLDTVTAPQAEKELQPVVTGSPRDVVFDLAELSFISSAGLRVLLGARKTLSARGAQVHLANLQPQIEKVLDIVKALPGINVFKDVRELDQYLAAMQKKVAEGDE
jgi:anti-sigma B factor antagonist